MCGRDFGVPCNKTYTSFPSKDWKTRSLSTRYTIAALTIAPNIGKVAWRDALVKEVCWLTGTSPEARIATSMRRKPGQFFEMWEQLRGKASSMIATKKGKGQQPLFTLDLADVEKLDPGLSAASGSTESKDKFILASLLVKDRIAKTKRMRISVPFTLSSLKSVAIRTFDLPENSDLAFEVFDATAQDRWHHVSWCVP